MSVIKLKTNNNVSNVEPHDELMKERGGLSDGVRKNNGMFQFNDNIISSTGSTRSRGERAGRGVDRRRRI
eukprot:5571990-Heterocapsa_arctica.AAC.1